MPHKKTIKVYRTNLISVGLGQGLMETTPFLAGITVYDKRGLPVSQSGYTAEGLLSERLDIDYDDQGRVVRETYYADESEPSEIVEYERNGGGEILREEKRYLDGSTDVTTYRYDQNGNLTEKITRDDEGVADRNETFTWEEGRLIARQVTDEEGNIVEAESFLFDNKGNIIEHRKESAETGEDFKVVREYDENGRKTAERIFDGDDNLMESLLYSLDENGRVISSSNQSPARQSETQYFYDAHGNPLGQEETTTEGNQILWVEHSYDEAHNLSRSVIFIHGGLRSPGQHYSLDYSYEWYTD